MAIVNVTPDSFSDGGVHLDSRAALAGAARMVAEGAAILDVGGESSRPGHAIIPEEEEWARLAPVLEGLLEGVADAPVPVSVDTWKSGVARRALAVGASIVNDVWGFRRDPGIAPVVAEAGAACILMHNGEGLEPEVPVLDLLARGFERSLDVARAAGVAEDAIVLDPGIGFGKTAAQNHAAFAAIPGLKRRFGLPVLVGASRKSFIGRLLEPPPPPGERLPGTLAAHLRAAREGADVLRVHDVAAHVQALAVEAVLARAGSGA